MPDSRWIRVVQAPLRWWIVHPWAVLWVTIPVTMVVWSDLAYQRSRFQGDFLVFAMVVGSMSLAMGLRLSWHKSRERASLIAACLALCALFLLVLLMSGHVRSEAVRDVTQSVVLIALIIGGAVGLEYAARARPLRELLEVPTPRSLLAPGLLILLAWVVWLIMIGVMAQGTFQEATTPLSWYAKLVGHPTAKDIVAMSVCYPEPSWRLWVLHTVSATRFQRDADAFKQCLITHGYQVDSSWHLNAQGQWQRD